ncbi:putative polyhydroxyalkanoate system protein [Sphingomonas insulae]|uniref:Polyhydroxyalkanoic acid system protein n=1 Tax=Sphingomonas insulae TaxID=424800 RepID=A0ABN1HXB0_9SPHN|nr:polyhydroxyalkanoic acid system family protein [Sphingomonas insulae]NIJ29872.1 putative polyhydroxyalkanoate system protein [Sphingomonas insulae]
MANIPFDIPHALGKDEARRRIDAGLPRLAQHIPGGGTVDADWTGADTLAMAIVTMGQKVAVDMTVGEANVDGTVKVPMMLAMMSGPIAEFVKTSAEKMLAKPA